MTDQQSPTEAVEAHSTPPYIHQEAVLSACANGDIDALQILFKKLDIKTGDAVPDYWCNHTPWNGQAPLTSTMLDIAIANRHYNVTTLIKKTFAGVCASEGVITRILDQGDVDALRMLHTHDKDVVNFTFGDNFTIYTGACKGPPDKTGPILVFLGEHGVDFEAAPMRPLTSNLVPAIAWGGHSAEVLEVLARNGAKIDSLAVDFAIKGKRADVLQLFIDMGGLSVGSYSSWEDMAAYHRKVALGTDDVLIVKLLEQLLALEKEKCRQREDDLARKSRKGWFKFF